MTATNIEKVKQSDALELTEPSKSMYAAVGKVVGAFAKLENVIDEFVLTASSMGQFQLLVNKFYRTKPPKMFGEREFRWQKKPKQGKADFVIDCYIVYSPLRRSGMVGDDLNLNHLALAIEEAWTFRNILIHTDLSVSKHWETTFSMKGMRWTRRSKKTFGRDEVHFGRGWLLHIYNQIWRILFVLLDGIRILNGEKVWEKYEEMQKTNWKGKELLANLEASGGTIDYSGRFFSKE